MIRHCVCEDRSGIAERFVERFPDPLHRLVGHAHFPILVVDTSEEPGVKAHLSKEARVTIRVTKGIDVPANDWDRIISKLTLEPLVTDEHVVHHVVVVRTGLVMHGPASVHKFKTTLFDKVAHSVFFGLILVVPPHGEEFHLDLAEALLFVGKKLNYIGVNNVLHIGGLDVLRGAREVLIGRLEPADVIVTVRNQMNVQVFVALGKSLFELVRPLLGVTMFHVLGGVGSKSHVCKVTQEGRLNQSSLHLDMILLFLSYYY